MQKVVIGEPADMSWARAIVLATGFFFLSVIYLGQIPAFFELTSNQATLGRFSQSLLELGLLAGGMALIGFTASFLYDPKPVSPLFRAVFGLLGLGLSVVGTGLMLFAFTTKHEYFPDQTVQNLGPGKSITTTWPFPDHGWFLSNIWFQPQSVDISAVGFLLLVTGAGILSYVLLYGPFSKGKLNGPIRNMLMQLSVGSAGALVLAYLTMYTFSPQATVKTWGLGAVENVILGVALGLVLFALQVWLLPVMTAPTNRQRFMPANYLHAAMLLGNVAVPLLGLFVILFPLVNLLASVLPKDNYFVQCSVANNIPGSCTFTSYIGYLVAGIVAGMLFTFMIAAGYLWNRKPAFVRMGSVYAFIFASLAVVGTHTVDAAQTAIALVLAVGVAILGLVWTVSTQREFVPARQDARALGCTGQWLVMGTLLLIYLAGFALFSYPNFLDTEQNLVIVQGSNSIHDAYWVLLIASILGAIQFGFLMRRQPIGSVRKLTLWLVLIGAGLQIASSITISLQHGSYGNWTYIAGLIVEGLGILVGAWGSIQTANKGGIGFLILSAVTTFIGIALAIFFANLKMDQLVVAFSTLAGTGAILYTIYGADAPDPLGARYNRGGGPAATTATPQRP